MFFDAMFNCLLRNNKAQTTLSEYVLVSFVVMAAMASMMIYFKRAAQAKIYDARQAMLNIVYTEAQGYYTGNIYTEYEPYYTNTVITTGQEYSTNTEYITTNFGDEVWKKFKEDINSQITSETAPPNDAY